MVTEKTGNIFTSKCQTIVNTVNCVGVMGAGIAFEFRIRYPDMYKEYVSLCDDKKLNIGILWLYKSTDKWILNFPTKYHWKYPSQPVYLEKGLQKFVDTYNSKAITSIAFPLLGVSNGGIPKEQSLEIMHRYLSRCNLEIEIFHYDANAEDDLYQEFKERFLGSSDDYLKRHFGLDVGSINKLRKALQHDSIYNMSGLLNVKGLGEKTLEKAFYFARSFHENEQISLWD